MGKSIAVTLADGTIFPSYDACEKFIKNKKESYVVGADIPGKDGEIIRLIYSRHPHVAQGLAEGREIEKCCPIWNKIPGKAATKGIQIILSGALPIDLRPGMREAISGKLKPHTTQVKQAARDIVQREINQFKLKLFAESESRTVTCSLSGEECSNPREMDIDHVNIEFISIFESFMRYKGLSYGDIAVCYENPDSPVSLLRFENVSLCDEWANWHRQQADVQPVLRGPHLGKRKTVRNRKNAKQLFLGFDNVA